MGGINMDGLYSVPGLTGRCGQADVGNVLGELMGKDLHKPGEKDDSKKPDASLLLDFGPAFMEMAKLSTFGAGKYSRGGWKEVPEAEERYTAALVRHLLSESKGEIDDETGLLHATAVLWNAAARLMFILERRDAEEKDSQVPALDSVQQEGTGPEGC